MLNKSQPQKGLRSLTGNLRYKTNRVLALMSWETKPRLRLRSTKNTMMTRTILLMMSIKKAGRESPRLVSLLMRKS